jgi:hypothetical protein
MKRLAFFLFVFTVISASAQQQNYWQQEVHYNIDVKLNVADKSIKGFEQIEYINHSPDTLTYIWFHLWPNAYKNNSTALYNQYKEGDKAGLAKFKKADKGYIDSLNFKINDQSINVEVDKENIDIVKLILPQPLAPGSKIIISTPFYVKFPTYFSRSGFIDDAFAVCQWYPKPAVYDRKGWHPMSYLNMGEYYSEFGSFNVNITVPSNYIVAATGTLQTEDELQKLKAAGKINKTRTKNFEHYVVNTSIASKTLSYKAENVHDFAWFTDNDFVVQYDTLALPSGKIIDAFTFFSNNANTQWSNSVDHVEDAVRNYSKWIGEYPYPTVNAVEGPGNVSSGGMEYPMVTLITSPSADKETLDAVITHEVGHNWFYGILGSNERLHAWMDEGLNTFFQFRYEAEKYRSNSVFGNALPAELKKRSADEFMAIVYNALNELPMNEAIETESEKFKTKDEYGMVIYLKTAVWAYLLEQGLGADVFAKAIHTYYEKWKFRHPYPEDFKQVLEEVSGKNLDNYFALLKERRKL